MSVDKVEKVKTCRIMVEKVKTCRFLVEKVQTYLCGVESTSFLKCPRKNIETY